MRSDSSLNYILVVVGFSKCYVLLILALRMGRGHYNRRMDKLPPSISCKRLRTEHQFRGLSNGYQQFGAIWQLQLLLSRAKQKFVYFQVNNGIWYFLDYVQDFGGGPLCPVILLLHSSRL